MGVAGEITKKSKDFDQYEFEFFFFSLYPLLDLHIVVNAYFYFFILIFSNTQLGN